MSKMPEISCYGLFLMSSAVGPARDTKLRDLVPTCSPGLTGGIVHKDMAGEEPSTPASPALMAAGRRGDAHAAPSSHDRAMGGWRAGLGHLGSARVAGVARGVHDHRRRPGDRGRPGHLSPRDP